MRTMLLISTVAFLAACSNDSEVTSPNVGKTNRPATGPAATPPAGAQGVVIAQSFTSINKILGTTQTVYGLPGSQTATSTATCPGGSFATGGGVITTKGGLKLKVTTSAPNDALTAWTVTAEWGGDMYNMSDWGEFKATVVCMQ